MSHFSLSIPTAFDRQKLPHGTCMIKHEFTGAKWFIEGDIKGCFDNIDHSTLIGVLNRKIKDARFLNLIRMFLKSGVYGRLGFP